MAEMIINAKTLPEPIFGMIRTEKVRVIETDGIIQLMPVRENEDCTLGLRGILAEYDNMSVDKFLERCRADKELEQ